MVAYHKTSVAYLSTGKPGGDESQDQNEDLHPDFRIHCVALLGVMQLARLPAAVVIGQPIAA